MKMEAAVASDTSVHTYVTSRNTVTLIQFMDLFTGTQSLTISELRDACDTLYMP